MRCLHWRIIARSSQHMCASTPLRAYSGQRRQWPYGLPGLIISSCV
jgi:hypothetical protein